MSDCELTFNCVRQVLRRTDGSVVAADAVKKLYTSFILCPNWDGLTVYARFEHEAKGIFDIELAGGCAVVPWEVISVPSFSVSLFGEDGEGARLTSTRVNVAVTRSGDYYEKEPIDQQEPTPSILAQMQKAAQEAHEAAQEAKDAAEKAQSGGGIKGEKGDPGEPGADGTSVTVSSVSESAEDGGANVVTFSDGSTLTVRNGNKGSKGDDGDAGPQGDGVPTVTASDAGKFLRVQADGTWAAEAVPSATGVSF